MGGSFWLGAELRTGLHAISGQAHADEATEAGFWKPAGLAERYARIQILSIEELLAGKTVDYQRYS